MSTHAKRIARLATLGLAAAAAAGCATPELDRRIAELRAQIQTEREVLAPLAQPYRGLQGKDVQADVSGRPLREVIDRFNGLSVSDRTMSLRSYQASGYFARGWTDCPWPFPGRIGYEVRTAFDEAFFLIIYVDHIDHSWNANDGLAFRLQRTFGAGGLLVGVRTELCGIITDLPFGLAAIIAGANSAAGHTEVEPIPNEGIRYRISLTQPIYMYAIVVTPFFSAHVPAWFRMRLTQGIIPNIMGREGVVQITRNGEERRYVLNIRLDSAGFLDEGLRVAGPVEVQWQTAAAAPEGAVTSPDASVLNGTTNTAAADGASETQSALPLTPAAAPAAALEDSAPNLAGSSSQ